MRKTIATTKKIKFVDLQKVKISSCINIKKSFLQKATKKQLIFLKKYAILHKRGEKSLSLRHNNYLWPYRLAVGANSVRLPKGGRSPTE